MATDIEQKVIQVVAEQMGLDKSEVTLSTRFKEDLSTDSLDDVELVMELEDEFEFSVPDADAETIKTVGDAVEYIKRHVVA